jgi:hypothetical protein
MAMRKNARCIFSTVKCIEETDTFSNTGHHEVPYMLSRSQYGTISVMMIFSSSPGAGKHSIGNELCSSDDSVTQLVHDKQRLLQTPRRKIQRSQIWVKKGPENGSPLLPIHRPHEYDII